jgi:hypothetical protein
MQRLRKLTQALILIGLTSISALLILLTDLFLSEALKINNRTIFSEFQYNYMMPISKKVLPDIAYISVVLIFYIISATVVDTTVYESVDSYLKNYESHPDRITYMCFNILGQGLLLSTGYFSVFITLIKITTFHDFSLDDPGFLLIISSILAGAMKFPKRENTRWNDYFLNSYAVFLSVKALCMFVQRL